ADPDAALAHPLDREEAVAEVRLRCRACADPRTRLRDQVQLGAVGVRGVNDRGPFAQAAGALEQLDRADAVLREALLGLARLFVRVNVQRQALGNRIAADLL